MKVCWPYFDPEFENLEERIYGPSCHVCIDNESCKDCTVVKIDTVNKQGLLLRVVQALTDMNLSISKGYISSDAEWFMDVFHVKDEHGNKLTDKRVVNHIQKNVQAIHVKDPHHDSRHAVVKAVTSKPIKTGIKTKTSAYHSTAIEITSTDRPGLLSEISAALADLRCLVIEAHAWSHNEYLACVAYISDQSTSNCINDPHRLATIKDHLTTIIHARTTSIDDSSEQRVVETADLPEGGDVITNVEHRLHQLMLAGRDFEGSSSMSTSSSSSSISGIEEEINKRTIQVSIENCSEKGYSIVNVECKDRRRLMFDTVCTLTDMEYMVFHASIISRRGCALQEYYIRHINGYVLNTDVEKERVIKCLEAAIERRVCEGVRLELCGHNRLGLLSDITRVLRENGLVVVRADVKTQGEKAVNAFYVKNVSGNEVDMEVVESMKREMEPDLALEIKKDSPKRPTSTEAAGKPRISFGDLLRSKLEILAQKF